MIRVLRDFFRALGTILNALANAFCIAIVFGYLTWALSVYGVDHPLRWVAALFVSIVSFWLAWPKRKPERGVKRTAGKWSRLLLPIDELDIPQDHWEALVNLGKEVGYLETRVSVAASGVRDVRDLVVTQAGVFTEIFERLAALEEAEAKRKPNRGAGGRFAKRDTVVVSAEISQADLDKIQADWRGHPGMSAYVNKADRDADLAKDSSDDLPPADVGC